MGGAQYSMMSGINLFRSAEVVAIIVEQIADDGLIFLGHAVRGFVEKYLELSRVATINYIA